MRVVEGPRPVEVRTTGVCSSASCGPAGVLLQVRQEEEVHLGTGLKVALSARGQDLVDSQDLVDLCAVPLL